MPPMSTKKKSPRKTTENATTPRERGEVEAARQRAEQPEQEQRRVEREQEESGEAKASQLGAQRYPEPPLPKQHLPKPGNEYQLRPRPQYLAPAYRGSGKLEGKVAFITGGDSGIGRAVAVLFAREGADVAIGYLSEHEDAQETKHAVEVEGRRCLLLPGDVGDPKYARTAVQRTVRALGKLDILVNNAAYQQHQKSLLDITDAQLERTFRTNIFGYFYMARAALAHMGEGGVILNCGSVTGTDGSAELLDYAATKGAIAAFTKSLAQNLLPKGIRVNCVAPGPVWTPLNPADLDAEQTAKFGAGVPMKRPAQPEEIAPAFVFLAAPSDSSYITGEVLNLFGGKPTP
jgi:NAD(P)-dependent dehydrogenase (short-subunit alcohol dehydrogenase family)